MDVLQTAERVVRRRDAEQLAAELVPRLGDALDLERAVDPALPRPPHKTSMLQDMERGRPMEIDALLAAVQDFARLTGVPTPGLDTILALLALRARVAGTY